MDDAPFRIHDSVNGMHRLTLGVVGEEQVIDVRRQFAAQYGVPLEESKMLVDGVSAPDSTPLRSLVDRAWIALVHCPAAAGQGAAAPAAAADAAADAGAADAPLKDLALTFIYQGDVRNLSVSQSATVGEVIQQVLAPAFNVDHHERLGVFLEARLLPRSALVRDTPELCTATLVPVVNDLVATRARDQFMPADAFKTDCAHCRTAGVSCKTKPICSTCHEETVMDVLPSIIQMSQDKTAFTWRSIESLTGKCVNPQCAAFDTFVEVHLNCYCNNRLPGDTPCPSYLARTPLASYCGGRVETLLEDLYRNQYFVRGAAAAAAARTQQQDEEKEAQAGGQVERQDGPAEEAGLGGGGGGGGAPQ